MSDPYPATSSDHSERKSTSSKSLFHRLFSRQHIELDSLEDVKALIAAAQEHQLLDPDTLSMLNGVLEVSELTAGDVMVPRSRIDMLNIATPIPAMLSAVQETTHSRFPVYEDDKENIIGILMAKDLLRWIREPELDVRSLLRPAIFIPESKPLTVLLRDFRNKRSHLALIIDEHGGISGLVTMEDVLEEIVGNIEDEFDADTPTIFPESASSWRIEATTEIEDFNEALHADLPTDDYDTVGGWLADELDRIPRRGDRHSHGDLLFEVLRADARRALWLRVSRQAAPPVAPENKEAR